MLLSVIVLVVLCFLAVYYVKRRKWTTIPGPTGIPFFGNMHSIDINEPYISYLEWQKKYGSMFSFRMAQTKVVCVSDPELIRQAFTKSVAIDRPHIPIFKIFLGDLGIIFSSGDIWQTNRRFTLFHLKNYGMGKSKIDEYILAQVDNFMEEVLMKNVETPVGVGKPLNIAVVNILWQLISGEKFSLQDSLVLDCLERMEEFIKTFGGVLAMSMLIPQSIHLIKSLPSVRASEKLFLSILSDLFDRTMKHHKMGIKEKTEPDDLIDAFYLEQVENPEIFTENNLKRSLFDLFIAGSDTTSSTLRWAICFMCTFPETQTKIQKEVDSVIEPSSPVSYADRRSMPYTESFIMETLRCADIAPMGVEHLAATDFMLDGHLIPKGTQLVSLLRAVHQNPKYFPQPDRFLPERFIDDTGKVKQSKEFMPFSLGKRSCLGEALARAELFLFITSIMQKFTLRFPKGFQHNFSTKKDKYLLRDLNDFEIIPSLRSN